MRDRSSWYQPVVTALGPWPQEHARTRPALLCQVELALRLMETVAPGHAADGAWTLLGGYGLAFARAAKLSVGAAEQVALAAARHLLWPMRRGRMWRQSLDAYLELPERLRAYRVPASGEAAQRVPLMVAAERFAVYDEALADLPGFSAKPMEQAAAGEHRFMDRRHRRTSVTIPADLVQDPLPGHPLTTERPATAGPLEVRLDELADVARWMDEEERRRGRKAGNWAQRLDDLDLDTRTPDGTAFATASALPLDRLTHLVGMVGAGKSTLMTLLAVWAHHNGLRTTLVVGDVAEQLTLTELFRGLGLSAALVQGGTTRPQHTQRLHRRLAARGAHSLLAHTDAAFRHLSTACPLDALRALDTLEPLRYNDAPCGGLYPVRRGGAVETVEAAEEMASENALRELERARGAAGRQTPEGDGDEEKWGAPHACPLWSACPRHSAARDLVNALIWVANPASLVQTAVPRQLNAERLRYLELACLRSDIVIVDEADRVQMQLDQMFAPSATLVTTGVSESWLDQLQTHEIAELARQGRLQLSDQDVERWSAALDIVGSAADRLYAMLIDDEALRNWAQIDYFSAWTLQEKLLNAWYPLTPGQSGWRPDGTEAGDIEDENALYEDEDERDGGDERGERRPPGAEVPWAHRRSEITGFFDTFRDDPLGGRGPYLTPADELTALAHDVLHTLDEKQTRTRVRALLDSLLVGAPGPQQRPPSAARHGKEPAREEVPLTEEWRELNARRLEFTLVLAALHQRLDRVTFLWPQVEAALRLDAASHELTRRPPLDYAPLLPEAPMGNVLGFQYLIDERAAARDKDGRRTGTLRFFRCAGVGRELLLGLPQLGADPGREEAGPHVLLMSGTSWAGTSTRAHVLAPVRAVLKPQSKALRSIRDTLFRTEFLYDASGQPIRLSGQDPDKREDVLRLMIDRLARPRRDGTTSPLQSELAQIADQRRRRALLLVGSYAEAKVAATALDEIPRWRGRVRVLAADDAELEAAVDGTAPAGSRTRSIGAVRRGDLASFAEDPDAELLVAPLLAVERGHNILTTPQRPGEERVAAFGTVFFLVRPHPRPDDLSLAVFAINDWASRFVRGQLTSQGVTFGDLVTEADGLDAAGGTFRTVARRVWRHVLSRPYVYSSLSDDEKESFVWDQLVTIWQVIGRLVRGGVPARVVFVDAAFAPRLAAAQAPVADRSGRSRTSDPGLLVRLRDVLAPYFTVTGIENAADRPDLADIELVKLLYRPLYEALCDLGTPPGPHGTD
ncbi:pPIWI_RE_Z domain-containing protein [Streptomyces malaysiensis]|uniref:pPIWI_RE_Z domain-containing protein n=1 Tax=Streptomyces malaysiensis TaxID=92644 RepID=UPI003715BC5C